MVRINEIMLVDDEKASNAYSAIIINEQECCDLITPFESSLDALEEILKRINEQARLPDVIFLDLNMPKLDGWGFLKLYEENDLGAYETKPKIYILTTSLHESDVNRSKEYKSVAKFCEKPMTKHLILEVLADHTKQR